MTDFRALCAELLADYGQCRYRSELHDRALAALAQPEPVERVATDAELCKVYNDAPEHGFGPALRAVYDLGRQHGAAPIRSGPESPLVERVLDAMGVREGAEPEARAAILEVAAWLVEQAPEPSSLGKWLGQISTPFAVMADMLRDEANR